MTAEAAPLSEEELARYRRTDPGYVTPGGIRRLLATIATDRAAIAAKDAEIAKQQAAVALLDAEYWGTL